MDQLLTRPETGNHDFLPEHNYTSTQNLLEKLPYSVFEKVCNAKYKSRFGDGDRAYALVGKEAASDVEVVHGPPVADKKKNQIFIMANKNLIVVASDKTMSQKEMRLLVKEHKAVGKTIYNKFMCKTDYLFQQLGEQATLFHALLATILKLNGDEEVKELLRAMSHTSINARLPEKLVPVCTSRTQQDAEGRRRFFFDVEKARQVIINHCVGKSAIHDLAMKVLEPIRYMRNEDLQIVIRHEHREQAKEAQEQPIVAAYESEKRILLLVGGEPVIIKKSTNEIYRVRQKTTLSSDLEDAAMIGQFVYGITKDRSIVSSNVIEKCVATDVKAFSSSGNAILYTTKEGDGRLIKLVHGKVKNVRVQLPPGTAAFKLHGVSENTVYAEVNGRRRHLSAEIVKEEKQRFKPWSETRMNTVTVHDNIIMYTGAGGKRMTKRLNGKAWWSNRCATCGQYVKGKCSKCKRGITSACNQIYISPLALRQNIAIGDSVYFKSSKNGDGMGKLTGRKGCQALVKVTMFKDMKKTVPEEALKIVPGQLWKPLPMESKVTIMCRSADGKSSSLVKVTNTHFNIACNNYSAYATWGRTMINFDLRPEEILEAEPRKFIAALTLQRDAQKDSGGAAREKRDQALCIIEELRKLENPTLLAVKDFHVEEAIVSNKIRDLYTETPAMVRQATIVQKDKRMRQLELELQQAAIAHGKAYYDYLTRKPVRDDGADKKRKLAEAKKRFLMKKRRRR